MNTTKTPAQLFRKKPVVVEAVQFTEAVRDAHLFDGYPLPDGVVRRATHLHPPTRKVWRATFYIETLEGRMSVEVGDWIITGVKGEHYPCKPDIFAATYEEAQSAEPVAQAASVTEADDAQREVGYWQTLRPAADYLDANERPRMAAKVREAHALLEACNASVTESNPKGGVAPAAPSEPAGVGARDAG